VIARSLVGLGDRFLGERPRWLAEAAYRAGLTVQQTLALHDAYLEVRTTAAPDNPEAWVRLAISAAAGMPLGDLVGVVDESAVASTRLAGIHDEANANARAAGWSALDELATAWMGGRTYEQLAIINNGPDAAGKAERHQRAPLPRVIRVVDEVFSFGLARLVGGLVALHEAGVAAETALWDLPAEARDALGLAPLAIRSGCGTTGALAWHRFAVRPRRLAHLLGERFPPPEGLDDDAARAWVRDAYDLWLEEDGEDEWGVASLDVAALAAWRALRRDEP
jgi:hypothetical protein